MNLVKWKAMEAEAERSGLSSSSSPPAKRRPLSDCGNYVIPTSTVLRRLTASLSAKLSLQNSNSKPRSAPEPNSNQRLALRSKPYDSPVDKPDNYSTRSNTSVGSSNSHENAPNPSTAEQSFPKTPVRVSTTNRGKENEDVFEPATIINTRRRSAHKAKENGTEIAGPFTSSVTRKSKRIAREETTQKTKENVRDDAVPSSSSVMEKARAKRKEVALPPSFASLEKQVDNSKTSSDFNKNVLNPKTPLHVGTTDRGKENENVFKPSILYSRRQSARKTKDNGPEVAVPFTSPVTQKSKRIAREETTQKTKDNGRGDAMPSSLTEKTRTKRKEVALPPSFVSLEKQVASSKASAVSTSTPSQIIARGKRKATSVPLSCPPPLKTRKIRSESSESRGEPKSCEVPNARHKKKRAHSLEEQDVSDFTLPADFVQRQRAYYKEVDDFELVEEEVSEDELE